MNGSGHTALIHVLLWPTFSLSNLGAPHTQPGHPEARPREPQPYGPVLLKHKHTSEPSALLLNTGMLGSHFQSG